MKPAAEPVRLLTRAIVCRRLGISRHTWLRWVKDGKAPAPVPNIPGWPRWDAAAIDRFSTAVVQAIDWSVVVRRALELAGISHKAAAADIGMGKAQFSRCLAGTEGLNLHRLARLPVAFHQWFAVVLHQRVGTPIEVVAAHRLDSFSSPAERQRSA